jgi:hypothetical protein
VELNSIHVELYVASVVVSVMSWFIKRLLADIKGLSKSSAMRHKDLTDKICELELQVARLEAKHDKCYKC